MKPRRSNHQNRALTFMDVTIILCIVCFLAIMLIPRLSSAKRKAQKISCTSNLCQSMLAIKIWESDHHNMYPMQTSVTNGGTMELMNTSEAWRVFQVMSNELSTSYILFCPADKTRTRMTDFDDSLRQHISYFVNVNATDADPQSIVFGDSAFEFQKIAMPPGFLDLVSNNPPQWSSLRHPGSGNVALADGSVQSMTDKDLIPYLTMTGNATNHIFIP